MSNVNCESVMPDWSEAQKTLGEIIVYVFHQKRREMESELGCSVALDQVAISYDYFVNHADEFRRDATSFDTIESSFNHFSQIGELIESKDEYKLNIEGELYKFWV